MSVSIVAGPAAESLLGKIQLQDRKAGVLTSESSANFGALTTFKQPTGSSPDGLLAQIRNIAEQGAVDDLIIQCEPDRPPMAYASLFAANNPATSSLATVAQLVSTTFVIGAATFLDTVLSRTANTGISPCFIAEQMEFVDQIVFDDDSADLDLARAIALALNPAAQVLRLTEAAAGWGRKHPARPFDFNTSLQRAGWRQLIDRGDKNGAGNGRVTAFGYNARRPFHPERFWNFVCEKSQNIFRAKGFFWVASRMDEVGGLNLAGSELHCSSAGNWWATRDAETRESEMPDHAREQWREPFGDRRQTFGIMALDVDPQALLSSLDACFLTDAEMSQGPERWREFPDPIPSWSHHHTHSHSHQHEHDGECDHGHDHDSEEHHCCHH
jgi:G3E family GTPase